MLIIGIGVQKNGNAFEGAELDFITIIWECFSHLMVETDSSIKDQVTYYRKFQTNDGPSYS